MASVKELMNVIEKLNDYVRRPLSDQEYQEQIALIESVLGKPCDMCKKPFISEEEYNEEEDEDWANAPVHICDGCAEQYQRNWDEITQEQLRLCNPDVVSAEIVSDSE